MLGMEARQALLDALTDHMAVYHCRQRQAERRHGGNKRDKNRIIQWLKGLTVRQRQAALTIVDASWVKLLLEMQRSLDAAGPGFFFIMPDFPSRSSNSGQEPGLCFRRARGLLKRLTRETEAAEVLTSNLRVFSSSNSAYDSVTLSCELLDDVDKLLEALDELSYGEFLMEQSVLGGSSWQETRWLSGMGYCSLATFVANRLEFAIWGAWLSSLGTKHPRSISKSSARSVFDASVVASRVCTKMQAFEDWWTELSRETKSKVLAFVLAKASKFEAAGIIAGRRPLRQLDDFTVARDVLQRQTGKFSFLCQGLQFLEEVAKLRTLTLADDGKWLACSSLISIHGPLERILRTMRGILMRVMNDNTEHDLLESGTPKEVPRPRKSKRKKQKRNGAQNVVNQSWQADKMNDGDPGNRRKQSKHRNKSSKATEALGNGFAALEVGKQLESSTVAPSGRHLNSEPEHKQQRPVNVDNNNHSSSFSLETPRTRLGQEPLKQPATSDGFSSDLTSERQHRPKASMVTYRPKRQADSKVQSSQNAFKAGTWSWDWPPVVQPGMALASPFGHTIRQQDEAAYVTVAGRNDTAEADIGYEEDGGYDREDSDRFRASEGEQVEETLFDADYNQFFGGGVMYWTTADYTGMVYSRPGSHSSEDSSWARREADLTLVVDDIVGLPSVAAPYAGLNSTASTVTCNSPSSTCSLPFSFDNVTANGSLDESQKPGAVTAAGTDGSSNERVTARPVLPPIVVRGSKVPSNVEFAKLQEARSPHMPRRRKDSMRWKRSPSPVLRCARPAPPPPPPSPIGGVKKKRGFATVRSGSSSPRHWGVVTWPDHQDPRMKSLEGVLAWRPRCIPNALPVHPLAGSLVRDRLPTVSPLALEQEHPDVAFPTRTSLADPSISAMLTGMDRLEKEIEAFRLLVAAENSMRKPFVNAAVKKVTHALQVLWPRSRIKIFGSTATGLALPNSDVDIVVCLPPVRNLEPIKEAGILEGRNGIKETCLQHAARYLRDQDWVKSDSLKTIENTAIPIIMLAAKCVLESKAEEIEVGTATFDDTKGKASQDSSLGRKPWGTKEDRHFVRLDISFESPSHAGLLTAELVKELVAQFPAIHPLALVLKQFLMDRSLDEPYTGGLSSYCLVLLITRFLQHQHHLGRPSQNQNIGALLLDFLHFFGCVFDPRRMCISIRGGGMYVNRDRVHEIDPLHIEDPLHPLNNVGRNCFRILQCTKAFADAYATLEKELCSYTDQTATSARKDFLLLQKILPSIAQD